MQIARLKRKEVLNLFQNSRRILLNDIHLQYITHTGDSLKIGTSMKMKIKAHERNKIKRHVFQFFLKRSKDLKAAGELFFILKNPKHYLKNLPQLTNDLIVVSNKTQFI